MNAQLSIGSNECSKMPACRVREPVMHLFLVRYSRPHQPHLVAGGLYLVRRDQRAQEPRSELPPCPSESLEPSRKEVRFP